MKQQWRFKFWNSFFFNQNFNRIVPGKVMWRFTRYCETGLMALGKIDAKMTKYIEAFSWITFKPTTPLHWTINSRCNFPETSLSKINYNFNGPISLKLRSYSQIEGIICEKNPESGIRHRIIHSFRARWSFIINWTSNPDYERKINGIFLFRNKSRSFSWSGQFGLLNSFLENELFRNYFW